MKVKAAKILWLAALDYVTEGKVYTTRQLLVSVI